MNLYELSAFELSKKIKSKEISAKELTVSVFDRIKAVEGEIGSYLHLNEENALKTAEAVDAKIASGEEVAPLAGIPIGIKVFMLNLVPYIITH